jgi:hypothetical protein
MWVFLGFFWVGFSLPTLAEGAGAGGGGPEHAAGGLGRQGLQGHRR